MSSGSCLLLSSGYALMMRPRNRRESSLAGRLPTGPIKPVSLVEEVSRVLREAILEGTLRGGEQLVEAKLQEQFGVSRSPIREALRDLEKRGLVEIVPRKGAFVRTISSRDIEENFPVRAVLEGLAAKEALDKLQPQQMRDMEGALEKMRGAVGAKDGKSYWEYHRFFHETFIGACGNQLLMGLLRGSAHPRPLVPFLLPILPGGPGALPCHPREDS